MGSNWTETRPKCNLADASLALQLESNAVEQLRTAGLRVTMPRVQVIRTLGRFNGALSAQEIHSQIEATGEKVDVVTVYRVLQALQSAGLVHRIGVVDGYYACRADGHHGDCEHLVCKQCGCVAEIPMDPPLSSGLTQSAIRAGFKSETIRVEVLGVCSHCQTE